MMVTLDDGSIELVVIRVPADDHVCEVENCPPLAPDDFVWLDSAGTAMCLLHMLSELETLMARPR